MKQARIVLVTLLIGFATFSCDNQTGKPQNEKIKVKEDNLTATKDIELARKLISSGYYYSAKNIIENTNYESVSSKKLDSIKTVLDIELGMNKQEYERIRNKNWEELTTRNQDGTQIWFEQKHFRHYTNTNLMSIYYGIDRQPSSSMINSLIFKITYSGRDWIYFSKINLIYEKTIVQMIEFNEENKKIDLDKPIESIHIHFPYNKSKLIKYLYNFSLSESSQIQLIGKDTLVRKLNEEEKLGILDVLESYTITSETIN